VGTHRSGRRRRRHDRSHHGGRRRRVRRSGCKSQAELERARSPAEVALAFADVGVQLTPARLPRAVVGADLPYRGATAYRYDTRATLWVLVCRAGRELQARVQHIVNDLDVAEEYGSRCYIQ
jgi:hypothetical protein